MRTLLPGRSSASLPGMISSSALISTSTGIDFTTGGPAADGNGLKKFGVGDITDVLVERLHSTWGKEPVRLTGPLGTKQRKLDYINFYGNLMIEVDNYLVEVMDALDSTGLTDDTIVIRTSDHGEMGTAHGSMRQKNFNAYEETLRIPMVYSNPDLLPNGATCDAMVSHVDLLPTLASLFDAPRSARADWQGKDYSKLVLGETQKPVQDYVAFTFDDYQAGQSTPPYVKPPQHLVAIREKNWKIAKYYDAAREVPAQWELYHLRHDKYERRNLAAPGYRRNKFQEIQFNRLKKKLAKVEETRLQPLPYKAFSVRSCTLGNQEEIKTKMRAPGRGQVTQKVTAEIGGRQIVLGKKTKTVLEGGATAMRTPLNPRELAAARREHPRDRLHRPARPRGPRLLGRPRLGLRGRLGLDLGQLLVPGGLVLLRGLDRVQAALAQPHVGEEVDVAAQHDVGAAAGHVGGHRDRAAPARLGDDARLLLVVLGVEHVVRDAALLELPR